MLRRRRHAEQAGLCEAGLRVTTGREVITRGRLVSGPRAFEHLDALSDPSAALPVPDSLGIDEPVLHSGHPSPPEADTWPAVRLLTAGSVIAAA